MNKVKNVQDKIKSIVALSKELEGHLSQAEMEFLAINAAVPASDGVILEIGSFKGKSTCILAKASELAGDPYIIAVDPLTHESLEAHDLKGAADENQFQHDFFKNLKVQHVEHRVQFHQQYSYHFVESFSGKIRFLWVDGDHSYSGVKQDIKMFTPFLADGAIVAMHDVLHNLDGPIRCFAEDILQSPHFGAAGLCGSIGWGRYHSELECIQKFETDKKTLHHKINQLIPYSLHQPNFKGWTKLRYKWQRAMIPHGKITIEGWKKMMNE